MLESFATSQKFSESDKFMSHPVVLLQSFYGTHVEITMEFSLFTYCCFFYGPEILIGYQMNVLKRASIM